MFKQYHIGHFLNQPKQEIPFAVMDFQTMQEPEVEELHKHTFYEILWIKKGKTKQFIDYQEYNISDNTLFFISQGQLHSFEAWQGLEGFTIMFTEEFLLLNQQNKDFLFELSFLDNLYANPFLDLSPDDIGEIDPILYLLVSESKREDRSHLILQSFLHVFLAKIQRCIDHKHTQSFPKRYLSQFKQFKNLLDTHFAKQLTASEYAEKLSITQHHLNLISKEVAGKTATEIIRARVILEAKRILNFSDLTITEIAYQLGFEENSYFSRVFKKETGLSPVEFRNKQNNQ